MSPGTESHWDWIRTWVLRPVYPMSEPSCQSLDWKFGSKMKTLWNSETLLFSWSILQERPNSSHGTQGRKDLTYGYGSGTVARPNPGIFEVHYPFRVGMETWCDQTKRSKKVKLDGTQSDVRRVNVSSVGLPSTELQMKVKQYPPQKDTLAISPSSFPWYSLEWVGIYLCSCRFGRVFLWFLCVFVEGTVVKNWDRESFNLYEFYRGSLPPLQRTRV